MRQEKWEELISRIKEQCNVLEHTKTEEGGPHVEKIIFVGPIGKIKLERHVTPKVIDKKIYASKRIGSPVREEFVYSDTETVDVIKAYKWEASQSDWQEMDIAAFAGSKS